MIIPQVVDTTGRAAQVTFIATAEDTGGPGPASGVTAVIVSPPVVSVAPEHRLARQSDGTWRGTVTLWPGQAGVGTGNAGVTLVDAAGNHRWYSPAEMASAGMSSILSVRTLADSAAPRLRWVKARTTVVDTRSGPRRVRVRARVTDNRSGVASMWIGGKRMRLVSGTPRDGVWAGSWTFHRWARAARWSLSFGFARTRDRAGNLRRYEEDELRRAGMLVTFTVHSRADRLWPHGEPPVFDTTPIDTTAGDRSLLVDVPASDVGSGVSRVRVSFVGGFGPYPGTWRARLVAGDRHDGTWRAVVPLPRCALGSGQYIPESYVIDGAGHQRIGIEAPTARLTLIAPDNVPPAATEVASPIPAGGPLGVKFSEDVKGITSTSVHVEDATTLASVSGAWACLDGSGSPVDCAQGPVREADFDATESLTPGGYRVVLNPEHVAGAADLSGNAFRRATVPFVVNR